MRIAIRVDASREIGTGHVRRSLSLAHALAACGAEVLFVTRDLGIDPLAIIADTFAVETLTGPAGNMPPSPVRHAAWAQVSTATDAEDTVAALHDWQPDWVVLDSYAFASEWHEAVRVALNCRIAVIDDLADRALSADLVIDHNYDTDHRAKYIGCLAPETTLLGGPRYALLGPTFGDAARYVPRNEATSIGVFVGGVDLGNVSMLALEAIDAVGFRGTVEIVSTSANPHLPALRDAVASRPNTMLTTDLPDLAAFFSQHDIQIGAGGGATWERCCIGAPTLLLVVAENQLTVVPKLLSEGAIVTPEPFGTLRPDHIAITLRTLLHDAELRRALSEHARALVDGLGARRVALRMLASELTVRPATLNDTAQMYAWRNDGKTRAVSRSSQEISWADHLAWVGRTLADPTKRLMVGTVGMVSVGIVRFDLLGGEKAEVSLYLDPALHGLGLGRAMLLMAENTAADGLDILAEVLDGNIGSARLFESAGYRRVDANHWIKPAAGRTRAN